MTVRPPIWKLPEPFRAAAQTGIPSVVAGLLQARGISDTDAFLYPKLQGLSDPFVIAGVAQAATRLFAAVDAGQSVTLFGDYDVDGVTSLSLLRAGLRAYGLEVSVYLPHRMDEGYGLSVEAVHRCLEENHPDLLVAVDCGTTAHAEAAMLRAMGVDLMILDHHEPCADGLPDCAAIVNPKATGEMPYLCSVGVVFKVLHAMLKLRPLDKSQFDLRAHLDLVALGTVADIVPLVEQNRILVRHGLLELERSQKPGLVALKNLLGIKGRMVASDIGFKFGPRLNAAGRLDTARRAYELLVEEDANLAAELAGLLDDQNRERQMVEQEILAQAILQAESQADAPALVLSGATWHPGVVGIVASRIMRQFHRPTFVIGFDDNQLGKGSARSIPGISLTAAIDACRNLLVKGGGHDMAAGITIESQNIEAFRSAIVTHVQNTADSSVFQPVLAPDLHVQLADLNDDLLDAWELLGPFGAGFPEPLLVACGIETVTTPRILKEKHYKFSLRQGRGICDAIWFQGAVRGPLPPQPWDVAFALEANEWNGRRTPQMRIHALRSAAPTAVLT